MYDLAEAAALLERTPRTLDAWLRDLPDAWTACNEGEGTWSAFDIVGHLIHGERTDWITRARIILGEGPARKFAPFDRFAQERESAGRILPMLLDEFAELRAANVATLRGLGITEAQMERTGVHPEFGEVTLRQLLATWVAHDLGHMAQVARAQARRYRDESGPWRAYLPILG